MDHFTLSPNDAWLGLKNPAYDLDFYTKILSFSIRRDNFTNIQGDLLENGTKTSNFEKIRYKLFFGGNK